MIYVVTPFDLETHLSSSLNRLMLQLWPSALLSYFLIVRTPAEASSSGRGAVWGARFAPLTLVILLLACVWASAETVSAWWKGGQALELEMVDYERRLSTIKTLLPDLGVIGYSPEIHPSGRQFSWTQYFLPPLIVVDSPEPELVVLNRNSSEPAADERNDGSYTVEEHDGMKLYNFGGGIYLEDRRGMRPGDK